MSGASFSLDRFDPELLSLGILAEAASVSRPWLRRPVQVAPRSLRLLPSPVSVTLESLQIPPTSKQAIKKLLAVITCPSHPLFHCCSHFLAFGPSSSVKKTLHDPSAAAAIVAGIEALPDGLPPSKAATAASFLTCALWNQASGIGDSSGLPQTGTRNLLQVDDAVHVMCQLFKHGFVSEEATQPFELQEGDGLEAITRFLRLWKGDAAPGRAATEEVMPEWLLCPRYLLLQKGILLPCLLCTEAEEWGILAAVCQRVVAQQEPSKLERVVEWLLAALVKAPLSQGLAVTVSGKMARGGRSAAGTLTAARALLLRMPAFQQMLQQVPGTWLEHMQSCVSSSTQMETALCWGQSIMAIYMQLFCMGDPLRWPPLPAPHFLASVTSVLLDVLEGSFFLLKLSATQHASTTDQLPPLTCQQQQQQQQQQQVTPDMLVKADFFRRHLTNHNRPLVILLLQIQAAQMQHPAVMEPVVKSGLGLQLFRLAAGGTAGAGNLQQHAAKALVQAVTQLAESTTEEHASDVQQALLLWRELGTQICVQLTNNKELLEATLRSGQDPACQSLLVTILCAPFPFILPHGSSTALDTEALHTLHRLVAGLLLPSLLQREPSNIRASPKRLVWHALSSEPIPALLWAGGAELMDQAMAVVLEALRSACCREVVDPCFDTVAALKAAVSSTSNLSRQEAVACQKEALWRIGQVLEDAAPHWQGSARLGWHPGVTEGEVWDYVAKASEHKMAGRQLQQLLATMKQQGYSSRAVKALDDYSADTPDKLDQFRNYCRDYCREATAYACTFLCQILATTHPATTPATNLPPHPPLQALKAASQLAAAIAAAPGGTTCPTAVCALVSCLVAHADATDTWPLASEVWGAGGWYFPKACLLDMLQTDQQLLHVGAVAWIAALLRGTPMEAAQAMLHDTELWPAVAALYERPQEVVGALSTAAAMASALMIALADSLEHVEQAERAAGGTTDDVLRAGRDATLSQADVERTEGALGRLVLQDSPATGAILCCAQSLGEAAREPSQKVAAWGQNGWVLPVVWEGVDKVLRREWWRVAQGALHCRSSMACTPVAGGASQQAARGTGVDAGCGEVQAVGSSGGRAAGLGVEGGGSGWAPGLCSGTSGSGSSSSASPGNGSLMPTAAGAGQQRGTGVEGSSSRGGSLSGGGAGQGMSTAESSNSGNSSSGSSVADSSGRINGTAGRGTAASSGSSSSSSSSSSRSNSAADSTTAAGSSSRGNSTAGSSSAGSPGALAPAGACTAPYGGDYSAGVASTSEGGQRRRALSLQCAACGRQPGQIHRCSGCESVWYCGAECQRVHWKQHKKQCKALRAAR